MKGKFHPSYLNFCPAFVALEREKFLGQSSPNVQIPSNFPLASLFEIISRFELSLGYLILPREEKKRRSFPPYYLIFHCQRVEYACLSFPPPLPSSNFTFSLRCPTIFKCSCFAPHGAHRSIEVGGKGCQNSFERHSSNNTRTMFQVVVEEIACYL